MAKLRGVRVFVFEEGYIRPDWMTLEHDGVNGHSPFDRDPELILASSRWLPEIPDLPPITAGLPASGSRQLLALPPCCNRSPELSLLSHAPQPFDHRRRLWLADEVRPQRPAGPAGRGSAGGHRRQEVRAVPAAADRRLSDQGAFAVRFHAPGGRLCARQLRRSFRARTSYSSSRSIRSMHPGAIGGFIWQLSRQAAGYRRSGRLHRRRRPAAAFDFGGRNGLCEQHLRNARAGKWHPGRVLGDAVYDVPGLTHQSGLDRFWRDPEQPDAELYAAFKKALHAKCLVRGGLASASATETLINNSVDRLLAEDSMPIGSHLETPTIGSQRQLRSAARR